MKELSLMERFADPALFVGLTSGDKIQGALTTTLMGLGITFVVLVLIWAVIAFMSRILREKVETADTKTEDLTTVKETPVTAHEPIDDCADDSQLVAVIMAAIAASEGSEYISDLVIRKINRVSGGRPAWGNAGNMESIESRKV